MNNLIFHQGRILQSKDPRNENLDGFFPASATERPTGTAARPTLPFTANLTLEFKPRDLSHSSGPQIANIFQASLSKSAVARLEASGNPSRVAIRNKNTVLENRYTGVYSYWTKAPCRRTNSIVGKVISNRRAPDAEKGVRTQWTTSVGTRRFVALHCRSWPRPLTTTSRTSNSVNGRERWE